VEEDVLADGADLAVAEEAGDGDVAELLGYDAQPQPGTIHVQLTWQALADGERAYAVFVHILGPDGKLVSQVDIPAGTDRWVKGQVLTATYDLPSPPPGYRLEAGLYDAPSGKRLPVAGGADSVLLP